eukprot:8311803-Prorocentrum_lima.AAC.1
MARKGRRFRYGIGYPMGGFARIPTFSGGKLRGGTDGSLFERVEVPWQVPQTRYSCGWRSGIRMVLKYPVDRDGRSVPALSFWRHAARGRKMASQVFVRAKLGKKFET